MLVEAVHFVVILCRYGYTIQVWLYSAGVAILCRCVYTLQVLPHIPIASRVMIEIEANLVAVERIKQYSCIPLEVSKFVFFIYRKSEL